MASILRGIWTNGAARTWWQLYFLGDVKAGGRLVGTDRFGNRYYENFEAHFPRERWVEYAAGKRADGSQVPAEWHMWLHRMNDSAPSEVNLPTKVFETKFTENLTASPKAYVPYNTTQPKLEAWKASVAPRG